MPARETNDKSQLDFNYLSYFKVFLIMSVEPLMRKKKNEITSVTPFVNTIPICIN